MPSWKPPTPEQIARVRALVAHTSQHRYFFERLENPRWMRPLAEAGFFASPPAPDRDTERGTIGFPPWPESRYLVRMAAHQEAREDLLAIVSKLPPTENERVMEDIVDIALKLPPVKAAELAPRAIEWAQGPLYLLLPEKLVDFALHMLGAGVLDPAFDLVGELLQPQRDPRAGREGDHSELLRPEPRARFDLWHYQRAISRLEPTLTQADGLRTVRLLAELLNRALDLARRPGEEHHEDMSWIWRPAIEEHPQNNRGNLPDVLVAAVRDAAVRCAANGAAMSRAVMEELGGRPWTVFRRLSMHVAGTVLGAHPQEARDLLLREDLFRQVGVRHEYAVLLRDAFGSLHPPEAEQILGWIRGGPDLTNFRASRKDADTEDERRFVDVWRRGWLTPLRGLLTGSDLALLESLEAELGQAEHPEFLVWTDAPVWVGPTSPVDDSDLESMAIEDLVELMRSWEPVRGWREASPSGLGRALAKLVKDDPARFASAADAFQGVDATYVRELLSGLREAAKAGTAFEWEPVLGLGRWIVAQPRDEPDRHGDQFDQDPHWGWARKALVDLLGVGMASDGGTLGFEHRAATWAIVDAVLHDPDPTPQHEARYGGSNMDPATLSINTTRGEAAHTAIKYGLWVRRHLDEPGQASGFAAIPELQVALDERLAEDPSSAVRAVFGQWLPWLFLLDEGWTVARLEQIFPTQANAEILWSAAWMTYVVFCSLYNRPFSLLTQQYGDAIERLAQPQDVATRLRDPDQRLAEHLMIAYGRGLITLEESGLVRRFFERAPAPLRRHAVRFVGTSLAGDDTIPPEISARFIELWAWRRSALGDAPDEELAGFGSWPITSAFDTAWALGELVEILEAVGEVDSERALVKSLVEHAIDHPQLAVRCLWLLLQADKQGWHAHAWRAEIREVLAQAVEHGASDDARQVIDWLGRKGHLEYRGLLG